MWTQKEGGGGSETILKRGRDPLVDVADLRKCEPELIGSPEIDSIFRIQRGQVLKVRAENRRIA